MFDYIKQLEAFYSSLNYNPLSTNAFAIYNAVLHIAYIAKRDVDLSIANTRLLSICNLTTKQFQTARNELITKKYINYRKGGNQNVAPKYSIIRLYEISKNENRTTESNSARYSTGHSTGYSERYGRWYSTRVY